MKRSLRTLVIALLVAVPAITTTSCGDADPFAPQTTIERQDGLIGDLLGGLLNTAGSVLNLLGSILTGPDANGREVSAWIDRDGGTISTAAYTLTVPRGAVSTRTRFVIEPANNGSYTVELHAYRQGLLGQFSVGERGFNKQVLLTVSYAKARGVTDERKIGIVYIASPRDIEPQKTTVDPSDKDVTAELDHCSKYAMGQN